MVDNYLFSKYVNKSYNLQVFMLKVLMMAFLVFNLSSAYAKNNFEKFDVVELKVEEYNQKSSSSSGGKNKDYLKKEAGKKYAIVFSGKAYNASSRSIIVAPVILKTKDYTGKFVINLKHKGKEYIVFTDKLRNIPKEKIKEVVFKPNVQEKGKIGEKFNNIVN